MKKTPVLELATKAARQGTATARLTVSPEEAARIREAERQGGIKSPECYQRYQKTPVLRQSLAEHGGTWRRLAYLSPLLATQTFTGVLKSMLRSVHSKGS
jgi:hypothetical protein